MGNETKHQCVKRIANDRWSFHFHSCTKPATVQRNGKRYCKVHDPEYIKVKQDAIYLKCVNEHTLDRVKYVALQQCQSVNKDNPLVVAQNIGEMVEALKQISPYRTGFMESMDWKLYTEAANRIEKLLTKISEVKDNG
jgi:hypothetical protein